MGVGVERERAETRERNTRNEWTKRVAAKESREGIARVKKGFGWRW